MSSSVNPEEAQWKNPNIYSRKEKSLGLLCSNFLKLCDREGVDSIGLDNAADQLGVERRRIYDIVNILESVGVLSRKAKNQYKWNGFSAIPKAVDLLKKEGLKDQSSVSSTSHNVANVIACSHSDLKEKGQGKTSGSHKIDNRKEKSLMILAQNFLKLFHCSDVDLISLDKAASALLGDMHDPMAMKTKTRRLYDIANVFVSMNLIEKVKRLKVAKDDELKDKNQEMSTERLNGHGTMDFVFGPFGPASLPKAGVSGKENLKQTQNWEDLASTYRPQYQNKGGIEHIQQEYI
ncbi:E2F transcription factor-like E2FF isoform X4 [Nicotiana tabacum]|uniref:E2F transcription factor-like E2FF isoform X4 n=1 Tax=Nicotiana tabacum TaxID=4097 RepID=A0AC58T0N7_TOBAC